VVLALRAQAAIGVRFISPVMQTGDGRIVASGNFSLFL
jgi:hypothetical protein